MIQEDAKVRAITPPRTSPTATLPSGASSSTVGLNAEQLLMHEAARLKDPYVVEASPNDEDHKGEGSISPTQPFPDPKKVTFMDPLIAPDSFDANESDTGTFLPARSRRPPGFPQYDQHGLYIPHPYSTPYSAEERDDQDPQPDAQPRDPATEEELPVTTGPPAALSPNDFLLDLTKAMDGMDYAEGPTDATMHSAEDPPTLAASPPVETASPPANDLCVNIPPTDDPWDAADPWTPPTAYEEADGRTKTPESAPLTSSPRPPSEQPPLPPADQRQSTDPQFEQRMDNRMDRMGNIFERLAGSIAKNQDEANAANDDLNSKIEKTAADQLARDTKLNETIKNGQNTVTKKISDIEQRLKRLEHDPIERPSSQRAGGGLSPGPLERERSPA